MTEDQLAELKSRDDGSCRDMTFSALTEEQTRNLLDWLCESYAELEVEAYNSEDTEEILPKDFFESAYQSMRIMARGSKTVIEIIQLYVYVENDGSYFAELTFFPEDIKNTNDLLDKMNSWLDIIDSKVNPSKYYLRFENASWKFGDVSKYSGVICWKK